jgi:Phage integrase family.
MRYAQTTFADVFEKWSAELFSEKIVPFFEHWLTKDNEYVFTNRQGRKFLDRNFRDSYWKHMMELLNMEHKPHDTRHTCVSLLTEAGVDERIIKKIVGHKGKVLQKPYILT